MEKKINEQINPIGKGPLYLHVQTEFEAILITPVESYGGFELGGVLDVAILSYAWSRCKTPKCILPK